MWSAVSSGFFLAPGGALLILLAFSLICSPDGALCVLEWSAAIFLPVLLFFFFFFFATTVIPAAFRASLSSSLSWYQSERLACPKQKNPQLIYQNSVHILITLNAGLTND